VVSELREFRERTVSHTLSARESKFGSRSPCWHRSKQS
jgi:hypothetical protein